ncbi:MAG TPA: hypothetical protein VGD01_05690 [Candidatus Elarobacter sp.]
MHEPSASVLHTWADFYVITGSSAAALTGLMFVVITLVAGVRARTTREGIAAFSTPTVVHFCAALLTAAALTAPWPTLACPAALLGTGAIAGIVYGIRIIARARTEVDYEPDLEDWLSYMVLPLVTYAAILAAAIALPFRPVPALFGLAGASLLLIFIGIHNAWDVVTYVAAVQMRTPEEPGAPDAAATPAVIADVQAQQSPPQQPPAAQQQPQP